MSVMEYERAVLLAKESLAENDQVWFPRWIRRYALGFRAGLEKDLPVNESVVIKFSKGLKESGAPAWQRWQAVRAIEHYRNTILEKSEPDLTEIIAVLAKFGRRERNIALEAAPTEEELARLRGKMNPQEHLLVQTMRGEMRVLHYVMSTEKAYVRWVERFGKFVGSMDLQDFNELDIGTFLTSLAVDQNVATSTQTQAKSGLLFFYQCAC